MPSRRAARWSRPRRRSNPAPGRHAWATSCSARLLPSGWWRWPSPSASAPSSCWRAASRTAWPRAPAWHWCWRTSRCCCCSVPCWLVGSPASGRSGGAARPDLGCMSGWCCCTALWPWRPASWWPASPSRSSIPAYRHGSTIRCARRLPSRCRSHADTLRSIVTTSAPLRWKWRTTLTTPASPSPAIRIRLPKCSESRPRCAG